MVHFYSPSNEFIDEIDPIEQKRNENDDESSGKMFVEIFLQVNSINEIRLRRCVIEELKINSIIVLGVTNISFGANDYNSGL